MKLAATGVDTSTVHRTDSVTMNLLTTAEAMRLLGYKDRSALTRQVQMGRLSAAQKLAGPTGAYLFDPAEIERFKAEREAA